jgi:hypothetical protein
MYANSPPTTIQATVQSLHQAATMSFMALVNTNQPITAKELDSIRAQLSIICKSVAASAQRVAQDEFLKAKKLDTQLDNTDPGFELRQLVEIFIRKGGT